MINKDAEIAAVKNVAAPTFGSIVKQTRFFLGLLLHYAILRSTAPFLELSLGPSRDWRENGLWTKNVSQPS